MAEGATTHVRPPAVDGLSFWGFLVGMGISSRRMDGEGTWTWGMGRMGLGNDGDGMLELRYHYLQSIVIGETGDVVGVRCDKR